MARKQKVRRQLDDVEIIDMSHDGRGVARDDGKAIFVDGALIGERVSAEVVKKKRRFEMARTLAVHTASPDRVTPLCEAFGVCGGCALQHQHIDAQRRDKRAALAAAFAKIGEVEPATWLDDLTAAAWGYRRRARLGVKHVHKKGRVLVGFRERNAPYVADMARCEVLDPRVGHKLVELAALVESLDIHDRLPQIEVAVGDNAVALVLRVLDPPSEQDLAHLRAFAAAHDVEFYLQSGGLDTVTPLDTATPLQYALPEFELTMQFEPIDFIQVHGELNRRMVGQALALLAPSKDDRVLDLFCGLGNFSLPLARRSGSVLGIEGDHALTERARANAARNGIDNTRFEVADLFDETKPWDFVGETFDLALIDPPRTGAEAILKSVAASGVRRIVYVSCHPGTLARDAKELVHQHGFTLSQAGIMDMFPHTAHVESVAVFDRG